MILIIPSVSTSTPLKNQSKHNNLLQSFQHYFFWIEANQFWLCDECMYHIIELKAEIYNKLCKIYKLYLYTHSIDEMDN